HGRKRSLVVFGQLSQVGWLRPHESGYHPVAAGVGAVAGTAVLEIQAPTRRSFFSGGSRSHLDHERDREQQPDRQAEHSLTSSSAAEPVRDAWGIGLQRDRQARIYRVVEPSRFLLPICDSEPREHEKAAIAATVAPGLLERCSMTTEQRRAVWR